MPTADSLTPEQQQAQRNFAAATGLPVAGEPPAPRVLYVLGSRVRCLDVAEGVDAVGTVIAITATGGLKVAWDDGTVSWTHDRSATLSLLPFKPPPPRVEPCPACKGEGQGCQEECRGTGRIVEGGVLPTLMLVASALREQVAAEMAMPPPFRKLWPELLDELTVLAESADSWSGRIFAQLDHVAELTDALELERQRYEEQGARLRKAEADLLAERAQLAAVLPDVRAAQERHAAELAALHDHTQQLSAENEELRSEVGALRVEAEAARVAVQDATQAVLDAGAELSIERARHHLRKKAIAS